MALVPKLPFHEQRIAAVARSGARTFASLQEAWGARRRLCPWLGAYGFIGAPYGTRTRVTAVPLTLARVCGEDGCNGVSLWTLTIAITSDKRLSRKEYG
jgi:hypothetical protein